MASGVGFARNLTNAPANLLSPLELAARARAMARAHGLRCRVLRRRELAREGMGALLAVAQGSARAPCLIVVEYRPRPRGARTLALVGKSVTFDCGGLSIKPSKGMEEMKYDMAGGAAVLGALQALSVLRPRLHVVGILPASDNLISGSALRPGDILRSASGKTIEVINTDAEGRLLLADALHYARRFKPAAVVDVATLTGACVVALGTQVTGMLASDRALGEQILKAAASSGEKVWELPLHDEFVEAVKSKVADLKNDSGRNAGAITAGAFLSQFIEGVPWAHLDIAGTGWTQREEGYQSPGATGAGVRLLAELALGMEAG
jgi:leucyl aminopeptidase